MKFNILLDNPSHSYFPGQILVGRVTLDLDSEKKTKGLQLSCIGVAAVDWTETHSYSSGSTTHVHTEYYSSNEKYFDYTVTLIGQPDGRQFTLLPGSHVMPFAFQLPPRIPSTFQGSHGHVQYYLLATIKRSWKFDHEVQLFFTVNGILDLNFYPGAASSAEFDEEKNLCCLCCKSGPLGFNVKINRVGLVPGEILQFAVYLYNMSSRDIPWSCARLIRTTSFHAIGKTRSTYSTVMEKNGPGVEPRKNEHWLDGMQIPPIVPTDLGGCKIISVKYYLEVELQVPGGFDLSGRAHIIIGTIAFQNNFLQLSYYRDIQPTTPNVAQTDQRVRTSKSRGTVAGCDEGGGEGVGGALLELKNLDNIKIKE